MGCLPEADNLPNSWPQISNEESRLQFPWHGPVLTRSCLKDKMFPVLLISAHTQAPEFAILLANFILFLEGFMWPAWWGLLFFLLGPLFVIPTLHHAKAQQADLLCLPLHQMAKQPWGQVETCRPGPRNLPLDWLGNPSLSYKSSFLHLLCKCILHGKNIRGLLSSPAAFTPG